MNPNQFEAIYGLLEKMLIEERKKNHSLQHIVFCFTVFLVFFVPTLLVYLFGS